MINLCVCGICVFLLVFLKDGFFHKERGSINVLIQIPSNMTKGRPKHSHK